mmetsp:Transcript_45048/g.88419  ORF Transcript_45048/g.88419 Transcript_45048/m.88419 type:complete len:152 (-) Transcript_45048:1497-1952(-)
MKCFPLCWPVLVKFAVNTDFMVIAVCNSEQKFEVPTEVTEEEEDKDNEDDDDDNDDDDDDDDDDTGAYDDGGDGRGGIDDDDDDDVEDDDGLCGSMAAAVASRICDTSPATDLARQGSFLLSMAFDVVGKQNRPKSRLFCHFPCLVVAPGW